MCPSACVVIRSFNEERHIGRLLAGIAEQDHQPDEVILVDSGSTDATVSIARRFPNVRVVLIAPEEFSFGRALNRGIATCRSEVAVMASAHVYPLRTSWLGGLVAPLSDPSVAISYGRQVGDERSRFSEHQIFRKWFPENSHDSSSDPFCNNANAAVRTDWWRANPYDEDLTGLEDVAAGHRAIAGGHSIAYVSEAPVVHVHEEDFGRVLNRYRREAIALKTVYPASDLSLIEAMGLFATNVGSDLYAALRQGRLDTVPDLFAFRTAQFVGGYLGHRQKAAVPAELKRRMYYPRRFWRRDAAVDPTGHAIEYGQLDSEGTKP